MIDEIPIEQLLDYTIDRFWDAIPPVWRQIRNHIHTIASEEYGVTVEQFHVLRHIRKGAESVSELAEVKQISRSAISQIVEVLVSKGLITREHGKDDRRFVQLALTSSGSDLLAAISQKNRAWMLDKLALLEREELDSILCALDSLKRAFDESGL